MTSTSAAPGSTQGRQLAGQTVVIIGGSAGIGLETALAARRAGRERRADRAGSGRLEAAREAVGPIRTAAFDVTDRHALAAFVADLPDPVNHVFITAGHPYYAPLDELDLDRTTNEFAATIGVLIDVGRLAAPRMRAGGALLMMSGTGARKPAVGTVVPASSAADCPPPPRTSRWSWPRSGST